jgi:hypothetical protein
MLAAPLSPEPETIRQTAQEILRRPDYSVTQQTRGGDRILDWILQLLYWLIAPFRWLFDAMEGLLEAMRWVVVIGLFLLLLLLVGHIIYTIVAAFRPTAKKSLYQKSSLKRVVSPRELERLAKEAVLESDYIWAIRCLFRASLAHLQDLEGRAFRPGLTNRGYFRLYRRSSIAVPLQLFVEIIDACWYGNSPCQEADYLRCHAAYVEISNHRKEPAHAHSA